MIPFDLCTEMSDTNTSNPLEGVDEYIEEEIEVTDDEAAGDTDGEGSVTPAETPTRRQKTSKATPGKVVPSKEVAQMKMKSPESVSKPSARALPMDKNPFPTHGAWTVDTMAQIEIVFPNLTGKNETTNELTRSTKPEARYWKAPITFSFGNFVSETLRFDNVHIPHHTGKGYGSSYVYLCLPGFAGAAFAEAGKKKAPTKVIENSLVPDKERWWKIANKVENVFGVINQETKRFHQKSLETIFDSTQTGISCSVILRFFCKASTMETEALRPTTMRTVAVEVVRGYINQLDVNVQMPVRVNRERAKIEPTASSRDVAPDSLMKRLGELGL